MSIRRIDLFAVQMHVTMADYATPSAFANKITALFEKMDGMRERDEHGQYRYPALAVFPENIGTFLLVSPYFKLIQNAQNLEEALRRIVLRQLPKVVWHRARYQASTLRAVFLMTGRATYETYYRTFSSLACRHQLAVVAGSVLVPDNLYGDAPTYKPARKRAPIYNLSLTFDARGEVVHSARKVNIIKGLEDALDLDPAPLTEQRPFDVCNTRVGNLICYDGFMEGMETPFAPVGPVLAALGAEIITQPSANLGGWEAPWPFADAEPVPTQSQIWLEQGLKAVLEAHPQVRYGVNPMLNGHFLNMHFEGQSSIIGRDERGHATILARAERFGDHPEVAEILLVKAALPARGRLQPPVMADTVSLPGVSG